MSKKTLIVAIIGVVLLALGGQIISPGSQDDITNAFVEIHTSLLAVAAIVFAVAFANVRYWPSLKFVSRKTYLGLWIIVSILAHILAAISNNFTSIAADYTSWLPWLVSVILGIISCYRILKLSDSSAMNAMLGARLAEQREEDLVSVDNAVKEAIASGNELALRDIIEQLMFTVKKGAVNNGLSELIKTVCERQFDRIIADGEGVETLELLLTGISKIDHCGSTASDSEHGVGLNSKHLSDFLAMLSRSRTRVYLAVRDGVMENRLGALVMQLVADSQNSIIKNIDSRLTGSRALKPEDVMKIWQGLNRRPTNEGLFFSYILYQSLLKQRYSGDFYKGALLLDDLIKGVRNDGKCEESAWKDLCGSLLYHLSLMVGRCVYAYKTEIVSPGLRVECQVNSTVISLLRFILSMDEVPGGEIGEHVDGVLINVSAESVDGEMETVLIGLVCVDLILSLKYHSSVKAVRVKTDNGFALVGEAVERINRIWPNYCQMNYRGRVERGELWRSYNYS